MRRRYFRIVAPSLAVAGCVATGREKRSEFIDSPAMDRTLAKAGAQPAGAWPAAEWSRSFRSAELDQLVATVFSNNGCNCASYAKRGEELREIRAEVLTEQP